MKKSSLVLFLSLLCWFNAAQPAFSQSEISLTVWAMGNEGILIRNMADRFEALHPNVSIVTQSIPWSAAHEKLVTGVIGDMAPDVCQLGTTWMAEFQSMNALEPLDSHLQQSAMVKVDDFFTSALSSTFLAGKRYGLPWYVDTRVFFYRTDVVTEAGFNEFPETWDELKALAKAIMLNKAENAEPGFAFSLPTNDWQIFLMFFWQAGGQIFPEGGLSPLLTEKPAIETFEYLRSFFSDNQASLTSGRDMDLLTAFETGFFPLFVAGPWMVSSLDTSKPQLAGSWTTAPMPAKQTSASFIGGSNLVMFKSCKNKEWAWKFIEFMMTAENQTAWYGFSRNLPAVRSAWDAPVLAENIHLKAFRQQLENAIAPPAIAEWEQIANAISDGIEPAMHGKRTASEALSDISTKAAVILHKPEKIVGATGLWQLLAGLGIAAILLLFAFFRWLKRA